MPSSVEWNPPIGEVPPNWIELNAVVNGWFVKVWLSPFGTYEAAIINLGTYERRRLDVGDATDIELACANAVELVMAKIN